MHHSTYFIIYSTYTIIYKKQIISSVKSQTKQAGSIYIVSYFCSKSASEWQGSCGGSTATIVIPLLSPLPYGKGVFLASMLCFLMNEITNSKLSACLRLCTLCETVRSTNSLCLLRATFPLCERRCCWRSSRLHAERGLR